MAQTGWQRSIQRSAEDQVTSGTTIGGQIGGSVTRGGRTPRDGGGSSTGRVGATFGYNSTEIGSSNETARASLDMINHGVRDAIAQSERAAARATNPERAFADELSRQILGEDGLRNRYLRDADGARGTADITAPLTSIEQSSVIEHGRLSTDLGKSPFDGSADHKTR